MIRRVVEILLAVVGVVVAIWLWRSGMHTGTFAPLDDGLPAFTSTYYDGPRIGGAIAVVALSVVVAVDAARPRRR